MEKDQKPDWITDREWAVNPNIYHWEQTRKVVESKPVTHEEAVAQERRRRIQRGEDPKVYDDFLKDNGAT